MDSAFNEEAAKRYDQTFTNTDIGNQQRQKVHDYLKRYLQDKTDLNILELNCGTGTDASFLLSLGHHVTATDSSTYMLKIAEQKLRKFNKHNNYCTQVLDLKKPHLEIANFDLVFSNFGGLNCLNISELNQLASFVTNKLKPNGTFIAVVMPPFTLFEKWYRIYKGQKELYKQRSSSKGLSVNVNGKEIETYYFQQHQMVDTFKYFKLIYSQSVGFIPSYFENSKLKSTLLAIDSLLCALNLNPNKADHYLIHLEKSKTI